MAHIPVPLSTTFTCNLNTQDRHAAQVKSINVPYKIDSLIKFSTSMDTNWTLLEEINLGKSAEKVHEEKHYNSYQLRHSNKTHHCSHHIPFSFNDSINGLRVA